MAQSLQDRTDRIFSKLENHTATGDIPLINYKIGFGAATAATAASLVVAYLNEEHGALPATLAAGKQFGWNLVAGGFLPNLCQRIARKTGSMLKHTLLPSAIAFLGTYTIHKFTGTPDAFESAVWQPVLYLPFYYAFGKRVSQQDNLTS